MAHESIFLLKVTSVSKLKLVHQLVEETVVILRLREEISPIIASVEDVVNSSIYQFTRSAWHSFTTWTWQFWKWYRLVLFFQIFLVWVEVKIQDLKERE